MQSALLDAAGHCRSPATMPGYTEAVRPRNKDEHRPRASVSGDLRLPIWTARSWSLRIQLRIVWLVASAPQRPVTV